MIRADAKDILDEGRGGGFSVKTRRQLIRHIVAFQTEKFGLRPNDSQKRSVLSAVIRLYPFMQMVI